MVLRGEKRTKRKVRVGTFEDASEDTIRVHRMVQDIIKEDVKRNKECLEETMKNIQNMFTYSLEHTIRFEMMIQSFRNYACKNKHLYFDKS